MKFKMPASKTFKFLQITLETLREQIREKVIKEVIPAHYLDDRTVVHINPCGLFIIGGPQVNKFFVKIIFIISNSLIFQKSSESNCILCIIHLPQFHKRNFKNEK